MSSKDKSKLAKPKTKRGRPPERTPMTFFRLVAEVDAFVAEEKEKNPKRIRGHLKRAIERCLKHDSETQPHSWWWGVDGAPLEYEEAAQLYHHAVRVLKEEAKQDPLDRWPLLSSLGPPPPLKPSRPYEQILEDLLRDKRALYEPDDTIPPARLLAQKRDFQRQELGIIAALKRVSDEMRMTWAKDAPKHSKEKVQEVGAVVKKFDGQIADFEVKLRKIGTPSRNFRSLK